MICYPADITEYEVDVLNDFWTRCDNSPSGFKYSMRDLWNRGKINTKRPQESLSRSHESLVRKSSYLPFEDMTALTCPGCNKTKPANSRKEYIDRTTSATNELCKNCKELLKESNKREPKRTPLKKTCYTGKKQAKFILEKYKYENFQPKPYIKDLVFEETLALFTLLSNHSVKSYYLGESPDDIVITDVKTIDRELLQSLFNKKALIHIDELPEEIEKANTVINNSSASSVSYHYKNKKTTSYHSPDCIRVGVFLNSPYPEQITTIPAITSILYEKLVSHEVSIHDVTKVHQLIKEIQHKKLYQIAIYVSQKFSIPINNSAKLRSLLYHLAEKYPPRNLSYTFDFHAQKSGAYINKNKPAFYIAKNYFSKFLGDYIQYIEENDYELKKSSPLPMSIETSSFEAIFSQIFLDGHFDWDSLSAAGVVALWLKNVRLSEDVRGLASDT